MHLLRFPNSGIRAKVFMRKIGFKLCMMRLNRVESFYIFVLRFRSEGNEEEGQQGMARPPARGRPIAAKAPLQRGRRLRPGPLQGTIARRGSSSQGAGTRSGSSRPWSRPAATSPQGAARDAPARDDRPWPCRKGQLPATRLQGGGLPCRMRRGSGGDDAEGGKERARASF
ncbi:hypothetical protein GW17_00058624 [Ensete ventricosum]|nr:hypothetical protein GW17_00058624 [Ensete ventricosum]